MDSKAHLAMLAMLNVHQLKLSHKGPVKKWNVSRLSKTWRNGQSFITGIRFCSLQFINLLFAFY